MRDADRIPKVLEAVERMWRRHPDWRLGQMIENIAGWAEEPAWDIEEDTLVKEIERHLGQLDGTVEIESTGRTKAAGVESTS